MTPTRMIGLGSMGAGMAHNLLAGGFALTVDDLDPDALDEIMAAYEARHEEREAEQKRAERRR